MRQRIHKPKKRWPGHLFFGFAQPVEINVSGFVFEQGFGFSKDTIFPQKSFNWLPAAM